MGGVLNLGGGPHLGGGSLTSVRTSSTDLKSLDMEASLDCGGGGEKIGVKKGEFGTINGNWGQLMAIRDQLVPK